MIQRLKKQAGFTLVEMIFAMLLSGMAALTIAPLVVSAVDSYAVTAQHSRSVQDMRHAMFHMTRTLLDVGPGDITSIADGITFDEGGASVQFRYIAGDPTGALYRNNSILAENVSGFTVTYRDDNGDLIVNQADIADIRRIEIDLEITPPSQPAITLHTEIAPRGFIYSNFQ